MAFTDINCDNNSFQQQEVCSRKSPNLPLLQFKLTCFWTNKPESGKRKKKKNREGKATTEHSIIILYCITAVPNPWVMDQSFGTCAVKKNKNLITYFIFWNWMMLYFEKLPYYLHYICPWLTVDRRLLLNLKNTSIFIFSHFMFFCLIYPLHLNSWSLKILSLNRSGTKKVGDCCCIVWPLDQRKKLPPYTLVSHHNIDNLSMA